MTLLRQDRIYIRGTDGRFFSLGMFTASTLDRLQHVKTLIIDNYDSYTFNLLQLFGNVANVAVIRNDQFTW